jgi:4-amino-4-deoxy-L-arabinose transferase-like glycosyltransferase
MANILKHIAASNLCLRSTWRQKLLICIFLLVLGLIPRVGYAIVHRNDPLDGDEVEYDALAWGLSQTGSYNSQPGFSLLYYAPWNEPTAFRPPGFPAILSITYTLFGHDYLPARILLALISALAAPLVFLIAIEIYKHGLYALIAGAIWALWPASIYYIGTASYRLLSEGASIFFLLLMLLLLVVSYRKASLWLMAGAGVATGLGVLMRGTLQVVIGLALLWVLITWKGYGWRKAVLALIVLAVSFIVTIAPWLARNYAKVGVLSVATQSDVFFFGNNAWARGSFDSENGKIWDRDFIHPPSQQFGYIVERHPGIQTLSEREKSAIYKQEALDYALSHKKRMLWLLYRKAMLFWIPLHDTPGGYGYSFPYALMLPFWGIGLGVALWKREVVPLLLVIPVIAFLIATLLTYAYPRYRFLAEPAMLIMAVGGAKFLASRFSFKLISVGVLVLIALNLGLASVLSNVAR